MQNDNYVPKVGEMCLLKFKYGNIFDATITYLGEGVGCFVDNDKGKEFTFATEAIEYFKALPTEEDKMVDEALELFSALDNPCLETIKTMVQAGYRKVEPISMRKYKKICQKDTFKDEYEYLVKNKHIIVKEVSNYE